MKKIVLTGGGTAGHVIPNIALIPKLREAGFEIIYIGSYDGIEKNLIEKEGIPYYGISSGKLRRYFSWKNFTDPFRVIKGFSDATRLIRKLSPCAVFSKGGFVSVPVVAAARAAKIPAFIHESDITPGLANRICMFFATQCFHTFPETAEFIGKKAVYAGPPIRKELFHGNRIKALNMCGFDSSKPVLLVMGGSLGAQKINELIRADLNGLLRRFQVTHLCGKGKCDDTLNGIKGYAQFEYIDDEMKDFFAMADIIVSRAGSNTICEIAALKKPNILIPLPLTASRGDQLLNAASFEKQGFSFNAKEETLNPEELTRLVNTIYDNRESYIAAMEKAKFENGVDQIVETILNHC